MQNPIQLKVPLLLFSKWHKGKKRKKAKIEKIEWKVIGGGGLILDAHGIRANGKWQSFSHSHNQQ